MRIGSFLDNREQKNIKYCYKKRGMDESYRPNTVLELYEREYYTHEDGNLFYKKPVGWSGDQLSYGAVDICIELEGMAFADNAKLVFQNTELSGVEVLTKKGGKLVKIGVVKPQTGKVLTDDEIIVPVGVYCDNVIVRLHGACKNIVLVSLDVYGAWDMEDTVYPIPENIEFGGYALEIDANLTVKAQGEDALFAAEYFAERFEDKFGTKAKIGDSGIISMEIDGRDEECFEVSCSESGCKVIAGSRRSLLYAAEVLMQISDGKKFKACKICDKPFMEFRGVHVALPSRKDLGFLKSLIKNLIVPMRYNSIILQISGVMRYDNFPEINEMWLKACENYEKGLWPRPAHYGFVGRDILEKSEVSDLCDYIRSFGLDVIPEIQSWSHTQYITTAYPELAEVPEGEIKTSKVIDSYAEDIRPAQFYKHSMCPSHERYYDVIFGILDEVLEVVKPQKYVHMGHDEIYELCICEKCKNLNAGDLYAKEVTTLNNYIKSKNLTMMIWSDMIQERSYKSLSAINKLPKDVIMLDFIWYFHLDQDLEDNLLNHGFNVVIGNAYSSYYPRFETRSKKEGIIGAEVSAWVACDEDTYSFEGKMYDYIYMANCLWNRNYDGAMRLTYDEAMRSVLIDTRRRIGELDFNGEEKRLSFKSDRINVPADLVGFIPYEEAAVATSDMSEVSIDFNGYAKQFTFVQAMDADADRFAWLPATVIGSYTLNYEDGTSYSRDIRFGDDIHSYRFRFGTPLKSHLFRHEGYIASYSARPECGKTAFGEDYTLFDNFVKNPTPEKKIVGITLKHNKNTDANIILFDAKATV